eukprot:216635_1
MELTTPRAPRKESDISNKDSDDLNVAGSSIDPSTEPLKTKSNEEESTETQEKAGKLISCLKSDHSPLTIKRKKQIEEGSTAVVHFDERVIVHTVPLWDPCGTTYPDSSG